MNRPLSIVWQYSDGVTTTVTPGRGVVVQRKGEFSPRLKVGSSAGEKILSVLHEGAEEDTIFELANDNMYLMGFIHSCLERLRRLGLIEAHLICESECIATIVPLSENLEVFVRGSDTFQCQLSRFTYIRQHKLDLRLECPEAACFLRIESTTLIDWLFEARVPLRVRSGDAKAQVLRLLIDLGFLRDTETQSDDAESCWEFHDRLFHRRTRCYDNQMARGGTYRFREKFPSPPLLRSRYAGEVVKLPREHSRISHNLVEVMECRRSRRDMGTVPVSINEVGEILYSVARMQERRDSPLQDVMLRPFPSGGAIHELEFYLAVRLCDGLDPGFYHYTCSDHSVTRLNRADFAANEIVADCALRWGQPTMPPQCVVTISSRVPRIAWKYEGIAYRTTLLNAGVALQALYLVCTDLGLNCSAAGGGNPDHFSAATSVNSWEETSVAEFGFGSSR